MNERTGTGDRTRSRIRGGVALTVLAGLLLSACSSTPAPGSTPTATEEATAVATPTTTATPTQAAAPTVSTIVMSGSRLVSQTPDGQTVQTAVLDDGPDTAIALLTNAFGTSPIQTEMTQDEACDAPSTHYVWDDAMLSVSSIGFTVRFSGPSVAGIALRSSGGFAVGDNAQAFFDALPEDQAHDEYNDGSGPFVYDKVADGAPWGEDGSAFGGVALLRPGGVVKAIVAPDTTRAFYC
ncbi:hypothetical protein [Cryobacterium sp. M25]|uniref:hypothetical protein n=1 Tax=Cryobacterium sp. M25 TaxID=2048293 RepID=UPI000CE540FF|nr:hypothetical protein [Cryobacterium sp. M25]